MEAMKKRTKAQVILIFCFLIFCVSCERNYVICKFNIKIDTLKKDFCLCKKNDLLCKNLKRKIPYLNKYAFINAEVMYTDGENNIIIINLQELNYVKRYMAYQIKDKYIIVKNNYNLKNHFYAYTEFSKNANVDDLIDKRVWIKIVEFLGWQVEESTHPPIIW
jgi:hypothetical protein